MPDRKLPQIDVDVDFSFDNGEFCIEFTRDDFNFSFKRNDGRWRWTRGPFVSHHTIASKLFSYENDPPDLECELMGGLVDVLAAAMDKCVDKLREESSRRHELFKQRGTYTGKDYFGDDEGCGLDPATVKFRLGIDKAHNAELEKRTFVYLMRHQNGLTKIGRSVNPKTRERTLQAEDPRLELVFFAAGSSGVESRLHEIYADIRVRGEWFDLKPHHEDWIRWMLGNKSKV